MKIHFIGVGGIGVSALAQYYLSKGHKVSGSDLASSEITEFLQDKGIKITIGNYAKNIKSGIDLIIYSPAVRQNNPEMLKAESCGLKTISYPEALGQLTKEYFTIAVSGTHGKSTTTSMLALVLIKAGLDPTVILGTKLKEFGNTNFRAGKSKILVIEADEYSSSFLNYWPDLIILTNIEKEHLDYFKNLKNILKIYKEYVNHLRKGGILVANREDKNICKITKESKQTTLFYSIKQKEAKKLKNILKIPGKHNIYNALAVLSTARILKISDKISFDVFSKYKGSWRRFDLKRGVIGRRKITIISDYGHHPTEVLATLTAARERYPKKKIWCVFQPHQHQRTHYLFADFVKTFRVLPIDSIIITDIYDVAGRETKKNNAEVSSEKLVKIIDKNNVNYLLLRDIEKYIKENIKSGDVLVIMGAGNIYKLCQKF